ncbi:MAG: Uncharacterised protein [Methanobacteriota archaeon]|nr:MAG: Uncharacterised protein [Euryarchaeota archaeon]
MNPERYSIIESGSGTSSLPANDNTTAMNIDPNIAVLAPNASSFSPDFSAFNIIVYELTTVYVTIVQGMNGSLPNKTASERIIKPRVTKCAQSERWPFCRPISPVTINARRITASKYS